MSDITITLHNPQTGHSESMPLSNSLTLQEVLEFAKALLGMEMDGDDDLVVTKDGRPLLPLSSTLQQAGVANGDLLAVLKKRAPSRVPPPPPQQQQQPPPRPASGGLDFTNLLGNQVGGNASSSPSSLLPPGTTALINDNPTPFYYAGMTLGDAMESNPHPKAFVKLLQTHAHLFKELNYHNPVLAGKLHGLPYEKAVQVWREEVVKGSIQGATAMSEVYHREKEMTQRLQRDPNDAEAKEYFEGKRRKQLVNEQYRQAMQEYPESMGRVLMLYVEAKINNHPLQAFVDSGAQMTIMSETCAKRCEIFHLLDTRFHGVAVGVGQGKILGKIHIAQLQIGDCYFPCSVTVMADATLPVAGKDGDDKGAKSKDMDFLLGLDMLKRFNCMIDLGDGKLKFRLGGQVLETPFLHEHQLDESKGGTKGFDANKANEELMEAQRKYEESRKSGDSMEE